MGSAFVAVVLSASNRQHQLLLQPSRLCLRLLPQQVFSLRVQNHCNLPRNHCHLTPPNHQVGHYSVRVYVLAHRASMKSLSAVKVLYLVSFAKLFGICVLNLTLYSRSKLILSPKWLGCEFAFSWF